MSSIGGLSSTTSSSLGNIRGYGGLASGLDRDSLIEGMTQGTMSKIYKQQQKKTHLMWEQTAIRNITDKMVAFSDKYLSSYSSSTNLFSDSFWGRNQISVLGTNSKYVSVSGSASTADTVSILGVKQLAQNAQMTSGANVSDRVLQTGEIDPLEVQKTENLAGKTIEINYADQKYTLTLPSGKDADGKEYKYGTVAETVDSLSRAFKDYKLNDGKKLGEVLEFQANGDKLSIKSKIGDGNILELTGGTALSHLGFKDKADSEFTKMKITTAGIESAHAITEDRLFTQTPFIDRIAGGELTFTYNGESKNIKMPTKEELEKAGKDGKAIMDTITKSLQKQLDDAFGAGRVKVEATDDNNDGKYQLGFKTTLPKDGTEDKTSILSIDSGTPGLLGTNGALKTNYGESNRINLDAKLSESGLAGAKDLKFPAKITINNVEIEINDKDTVYTLMDKINKSDAGVEMSYQTSSDRFVFKAKANGASGKIEVAGDFEKIFGAKDQFKMTEGQDAIVRVKYAGTGEEVELNRDSNSFKIDGLTVSVNGEFGYKADGTYDTTTEAVTFDAKVDEDKIVDAMKKMVEEYNEIIDLVNKETGTKPNRDFQPLTDAQKKEMSKEEIETWEEKAKEGLLFNDNDMKGLSNSLRFVIDPVNLEAMKKLGITTSSTASDNGKISFDESAFRSALKTDPEGVKKMFTQEQQTDANGVPTGADGIATNMKETFDKYVKTLGEPKGILIERAGSIKAPASITRNELYKQMGEIDKKIAKLQSTLKMEQDRYIKQFTALESVIAQMNSQSGWLAQFTGGY